MTTLDKSTFDAIVALLIPKMADAEDRQAFVTSALIGCPILHEIDFSGSASTFTVRLLHQLWDFGDCEPHTPAVVSLLTELRESVGVTQQEQIDAIIPYIFNLLTVKKNRHHIASRTRIFVAYEHNARLIATRLARSLSNIGADVWIDVEDIPSGMKWHRAVEQGLHECDILLLIVTPEAMKSANVEAEWFYFMDADKPIIPLRFKKADVHYLLRPLHWIDFEHPKYNESFIRLHAELINRGMELAPLEVSLPTLSQQTTVPLPDAWQAGSNLISSLYENRQMYLTWIMSPAKALVNSLYENRQPYLTWITSAIITGIAVVLLIATVRLGYTYLDTAVTPTALPTLLSDLLTQQALALVAATDAPTDEPTSEPTTVPATDVPVVVPSDTVAAATNTIAPTNTSIPPTNTDLPTFTPIPATATPEVAASAVAFPNGHLLQLTYTPLTFYIRNMGTENVRVSRLVFQAVDGSGNLLFQRFEGNNWARNYSFVERGGNCVGMEIADRPPLNRPGECGRMNSMITPSPSDERIFWAEQAVADGAVAFAVFWDNVEIARCPIAIGACDVRVGS